MIHLARPLVHRAPQHLRYLRLSPRPLSRSRSSSTSPSTSASSSTSSPSTSPSPSPPTIDRALLVRLHALAALNPPPPGSADESELISGLSDLIGLMDTVKNVEILGVDGVDGPEREKVVSELLSGWSGQSTMEGSNQRVVGSREVGVGLGVGEWVVDGNHEVDQGVEGNGRELLEHATNRVGDYYGFKTQQR